MKMLRILLMLTMILLAFNVSTSFAGPIIVDHTTTDLSQIPDSWINQVKQNIKVYFGHTSHGMQITNGLLSIESQNPSKYSVAIPQWSLPNEPGALCIYDRSDTYDPGDFFPTVPGVLSANPQINVVMYAWCGQPGNATGGWQALLNSYISTMNSLEQRYPNVTFVYMTGNAQEADCSGCERNHFNEALRTYCKQNNKVLFDFADLDVWYNGQRYAYASPSWCTCAGQNIPREAPQYGGGAGTGPCGHTTSESCMEKGKATWWLLAMIAGWNNPNPPPPPDTTPPAPPKGLRIVP